MLEHPQIAIVLFSRFWAFHTQRTLANILVGKTLQAGTSLCQPRSEKKPLHLRKLLLLIILLIPTISLGSALDAHAASRGSIPTEGGTWVDPTITTVIIPSSSAAWFRSSYTLDVSRAISRWTMSIAAYTDSYGSNYLRKLNFVTCISGINESLCGSPDIQVQFVESFGPQSAGLGLTSLRIQNSRVFLAPTTTTLAAYDPSNTTQLTDTDMINIASHEFGHALGLGHATLSRTDDGTFELMFLSYGQTAGNPVNSLEAPSTLDFYALAYVYDWLASSSTLNGQGHPTTDLSLPLGVPYSSVYPYAEQIQMQQESLNRKNLEILVLTMVAAFLFTLVLVLGILLARKKHVPPHPFYSEPIQAPPQIQIFHLT